MNSRIYVGHLRHRRFQPHGHQFTYKLFMMYLDLDELPRLFQRFWLWSYQRPNVASFSRKNYFGDSTSDLSSSVRELVENETGSRPKGPVRLLTHMKYFGVVFNPVSFFYCFDEDGKTLHSIVAEVTNTPWKEKYCYVLRPQDAKGGIFSFRFPKSFHVSPFNGMEQQYEWHFTVPNNELFVHMNVLEENVKHFDATMQLQGQELNSRSLAQSLIRFPLMTGKVIYAIYFQALRLWLKRTPFYTHPRRLGLRSVPTDISKG